MKKLLIFDLKNTLVYDYDRLCSGFESVMILVKCHGYDLMLYSMNEPWTIKVLSMYAKEFSNFKTILLTASKQGEDIRPFANNYQRILMVGDGAEEQTIAKKQGYPFFLVTEEISEITLSKWLEDLSL